MPIAKHVALRRLKKLMEILKKIPKKQFDMSCIASKTDCGTVGCLLGWAGMDPSFRKAGLKTVFDSFGAGDTMINGKFTRIKDDGSFFGMNEDQANRLFYANTFINDKGYRRGILRQIIKEIKKDGVTGSDV